MIQKPLILVVTGWLGLVIVAEAQAFDDRRMKPAARMFHDGAQTSPRDSARSANRRSTAMRGRGRSYDEILSAAESAGLRRKTSLTPRKGSKTRIGKARVGQRITREKTIKK